MMDKAEMEAKIRELLKDVPNPQNVSLEKFQEVMTRFAHEHEKTIEEVTDMLTVAGTELMQLAANLLSPLKKEVKKRITKILHGGNPNDISFEKFKEVMTEIAAALGLSLDEIVAKIMKLNLNGKYLAVESITSGAVSAMAQEAARLHSIKPASPERSAPTDGSTPIDGSAPVEGSAAVEGCMPADVTVLALQSGGSGEESEHGSPCGSEQASEQGSEQGSQQGSDDSSTGTAGTSEGGSDAHSGSSKLIDSTKEQEEKARNLFKDAADKSNVELDKFKSVVQKLAEEQKKNFDDLAKQLAAEGPKFMKAAMAGVTKIVDGSKELEEKARNLFNGAENKDDIDLETFKVAMHKFADDQKRNFDEMSQQLAEEGPTVVKAVIAGVSAFKDVMTGNAEDKDDMDVETFKGTMHKFADDQKRNFDEMSQQLAEEGPTVVKAVIAGVSAFKDVMTGK
ncbi:unnamed protein product [Chrysodeixis includens]|uniref:Uncharacterized protein n=1 Tax=Chrysodeixis includens TaxID=689277 RepID=A0A9N8Q218_CHRIL|nr:unnamed protein product [Chrysodeixis includens]